MNIADFTGERWISCFNDVAEALVSQPAQALGELKESVSGFPMQYNFISYI